MSKHFYKIILLLALLFLNLQADTKQELIEIKEKYKSLEKIEDYKHKDIQIKIIEIKNDIKNLEEKIEKQAFNKNNIDKDFKRINTLMEKQDKRIMDIDGSISQTGNLIGVFAILTTILVLYFSLRSESNAKIIVDKEINSIKKDYKKEIDDYIKEHKDILNTHLSDATETVNNIKNKEEEFSQLFNNLKNMTQEEIEKLKKSDSVIEKESIKKLEEEFLSAYLEKNYEKAIEFAKEIIKNKPNDSNAYFNLALAYSDYTEYDEAIKAYKKVIELNSKNYYAYNNLGHIYHLQGKYRLAISSCKKAIEVNSKVTSAYINIANTYNVIDEYDLAIKNSNIAIKLNPKNSDAYNNLGISYYQKREYDLSIKSYEKAIKLNPKHIDAHNNIGIYYQHKKDYELAIQFFKKAIHLSPEYSIAYENIFESQLTQNMEFDKNLEKQYIENFSNNKYIFIKYNMLTILKEISLGNKVDINKWLEIYKNEHLGPWNFDDLIVWANTKEFPIKENLLEAIEVFKTKVVDKN